MVLPVSGQALLEAALLGGIHYVSDHEEPLHHSGLGRGVLGTLVGDLQSLVVLGLESGNGLRHAQPELGVASCHHGLEGGLGLIVGDTGSVQVGDSGHGALDREIQIGVIHLEGVGQAVEALLGIVGDHYLDLAGLLHVGQSDLGLALLQSGDNPLIVDRDDALVIAGEGDLGVGIGDEELGEGAVGPLHLSAELGLVERALTQVDDVGVADGSPLHGLGGSAVILGLCGHMDVEEEGDVAVPHLHGGSAHANQSDLPAIVVDGTDRFVMHLEADTIGAPLEVRILKVGVVLLQLDGKGALTQGIGIYVLLGADHGHVAVGLGDGVTADEFLLEAGLEDLRTQIVAVRQGHADGLNAGIPGTPALAVGVDDAELVGILGESDMAVSAGGKTRVVQVSQSALADSLHQLEGKTVVGFIEGQVAGGAHAGAGGQTHELTPLLHVLDVDGVGVLLDGGAVMLQGSGPVLIGGISGGHHGVLTRGSGVGVVDIQGAVQLHEGGLAHAELVVGLIVVEDGLRLIAAPPASVPLLEGAVGILGTGHKDVIAGTRLVEGGGVAQVVVAAKVDHTGITVGEVIHGALGGSQDDLLGSPGLAAVGGVAVGDPVPFPVGTHTGEVGIHRAVIVVQVGGAVAVAPFLVDGELIDVVAQAGHGDVGDLGGIGLDGLDAVGLEVVGSDLLGGLLGGGLGSVTVGLGGSGGGILRSRGGIGRVIGSISLVTAHKQGGHQQERKPQQQKLFYDRIPFVWWDAVRA